MKVPLVHFPIMLFIFLLDNGGSMNAVKFPNVSGNVDGNINDNINNNESFHPTSMDASIYFIQQYCKVQEYFILIHLLNHISLFMITFQLQEMSMKASQQNVLLETRQQPNIVSFF